MTGERFGKKQVYDANRILALLVTETALQLGLDPKGLDADASFNTLGASSLIVVQIASALEKQLGIAVNPVVFFEYPTLNELSGFLSTLFDNKGSNDDGSSQAGSGSRLGRIDHSFEPIAIVGMGCKIPGAETLQEFWQLLLDEKNLIHEMASDDVRFEAFNHAKVPPAGYLKSIDAFDHELFGISSHEARKMDPAQRLLLETAWQTIEDAGYCPRDLAKTKTGVFIGQCANDYFRLQSHDQVRADVYDTLGNAMSISSNRLSYQFDFWGPSLTIDTACSSSLVAVHQACRSLRDGTSDLALAGGVNILLSSQTSQILQNAGMLSPDGTCKTFSAAADGYGRGEGVAMVLLKPLAAALRDGDEVYGLIRGSAVNQDGRSNGITAPNGKAQERVIREALFDANLQASEIHYIEAHGTGTSLGDPIEFHALDRVFKGAASEVYVGSIKTNIGHLEAAAGICGLMKAALSLKHRLIPKSLNFDHVNPKIQLETSKVRVCAKPVHLDKVAGSLRAGVSSFGFGGTNCHVVLESYPQNATDQAEQKQLGSRDGSFTNHFALAVSASGKQSLRKSLEQYLQCIEQADSSTIAQICAQSLALRQHLPYRQWIHGASQAALAAEITKRLGLKSLMTPSPQSKQSMGFIFTGQGSQYLGMGRALYQDFAPFRAAFDSCCKLFDEYLPYRIKDIVFFDQKGSKGGLDWQAVLDRTDMTQSVIFCYEYALFQLLKLAGIVPDFMVGHSVGEIVAAACGNALDLPDAVKLIVARGKLMQSTNDSGSMMVCFAPESQTQQIIASLGVAVEIAAVNAKAVTVVSGHKDELVSLLGEFERKGIRCKPLNVSRAFHSAYLDPVLDDFEQICQEITFRTSEIPIISTRDGELLQVPSAVHWRQQARQATQFFKASQALKERGVDTIIELGANAALLPILRDIFDESEATLIGLGSAKNPTEALYDGLGQIFGHIRGIRFDKWFDKAFMRPCLVPFTNFQKNSFWFEPTMTTFKTRESDIPRRPLAGISDQASKHESTSPTAVASEVSTSGVQKAILEIIADVVGIPEDQLGLTTPLDDFGADSLMLLKALVQIKERFGVDISVYTLFQELNSLGDIIEHVQSHQGLPGSQKISQNSSHPTKDQKSTTSPKDDTASGLGVLGNFKSKVSREDNIELNRATASFVRAFEGKTKRTKELTQQYRMQLADNRTSAGFRPATKEITYPIICERAKGSKFWDVDGNEYIDFTMGFGVNLFGHSPEFIMSRVKEQLDRGLCVGPQSNLAGFVAQLVCELTGHERVAFCNSGTEAVMSAIRLARALTRRDKVVIFEGSYHGHADVVLGRSNALGETVPVAPGVAASVVADAVILEYGSATALQYIRDHASELAAVLVEPVQSRYPEKQPVEFLKAIREITKASQTAFIWDEVICGFRAAVGGAGQCFGIEADISCYGKILGGGFPIGAIAGKKAYLDAIDGGYWQFGDDSFPTSDMTFFAGTFSKHPLAMVAAKAVLEALKADGQKIIDDLNRRTHELVVDLNRFFASEGFDIEMVHFSSLFRFKSKQNIDMLIYHLNYHGFYVWEGRNMFLSTAHEERDIQGFIDTVKSLSLQLVEQGLLKKSRQKNLPLSFAQKYYSDLAGSEPSSECAKAAHIYFALNLKGQLDLTQLQIAIAQTIQRHDAFLVTINSQESTFRIEQHLNQSTLIEVLDDESSGAMDKLVETTIDLKSHPGIRFQISKRAVDEWTLGLVCHHAVLDGWSLSLLISEIAARYTQLVARKSIPLREPVSYAKYLASSAQETGSQESRAFWREYLKGTQKPRLAQVASRGLEAVRITRLMDQDAYSHMNDLAKESGCNQIQLMFAALSCVIHSLTGQKDFVLGLPVACRNQDQLVQMVGHCVNVIPVRFNLDEFTVKACVQHLKSHWKDALRHMNVPIQIIEEQANTSLLAVNLNREPYFQPPEFADLRLSLEPLKVVSAPLPLIINVTDLKDRLHIECDYQTSHFYVSSIDRLLQEWIAHLTS